MNSHSLTEPSHLKSQPERRAVETKGMDPDGWLETVFHLRLRNCNAMAGIELRLDFPYWCDRASQGVHLWMNGGDPVSFEFEPGLHSIQLPFLGSRSETEVEVRFVEHFALPGETRVRAARLGEIRYLGSLKESFPRIDRVSRLIVSGNPDWKNVVLVAGMSCAGKTHFINRLTSESPSPLCDELEIPDSGPWDRLDFPTLTPAFDPSCSNLHIHFELNRGGSTIAEGIDFDRDRRLWDKLTGIDHLKIVTIETPPEVLRSRNEDRRREFYRMKAAGEDGYKSYFDDGRTLAMLESHIELADEFYEEWERFCQKEGFEQRWTTSGTGSGELRKSEL